MPSEQGPARTPQSLGSQPVPPALRHRLQKLFEHAQRCITKGDHDYANQLLTQCVCEDPANLIYLQAFLSNLQSKYEDNKKGAKFVGLKLKSLRSSLNKAAAQGEWPSAFQSGCNALSLNPWDTATLLAMAGTCQELKLDECQLFYLRWALDASGKDPQVNREAALALQRMGQFDQAIACWNRVEQAKPNDEEALRAISHLSVEKTIHQGGYEPNCSPDEEQNEGDSSLLPVTHRSIASLAVGGASEANSTADPSIPLEERLRQSILDQPAEVSYYLQLADLLTHEERFDDVESVLDKAMQVTGGGDLQVRERLEGLHIRRAQWQLAVAQQQADGLQAAGQPSEEAYQLAAKLRAQVNQVELEVYAARADREPQNGRLQYELGLRLKRAGKFKQAIPAFQAARNQSRHQIEVLVELGECFQKIEQYKLALSHYEQAIEVSREERQGTDVGKLALYRAGVLATGLRELDRAEQHLTDLAGIDFSFRDVAERLDKLAQIRDSG